MGSILTPAMPPAHILVYPTSYFEEYSCLHFGISYWKHVTEVSPDLVKIFATSVRPPLAVLWHDKDSLGWKLSVRSMDGSIYNTEIDWRPLVKSRPRPAAFFPREWGRTDIFFRKHDSSIFRQSSYNPVCGISMTEQLGPVLFGSSMNHIQGRMAIWICYCHALEK